MQSVENLIPKQIGECSLTVGRDRRSCIPDSVVGDIANILALPAGGDTMGSIKQKLDCSTERCVLSKVSGKLGRAKTAAIIERYLKIEGPTDDSLLSNINIDSILKQWAVEYNDFFPYNFNMSNYISYSYKNGYIHNTPDTLAVISFADLYNGDLGKKYTQAACVINSDVYQGGGKHWMALFADARDGIWTVEFFNSSGHAPAPEWVSWMVKTKAQMEALAPPGVKVEMIRTSDIQHQHSKSECGVYSLFYIWARLNGVPVVQFAENEISDKFMFEFRQHLFHDPSRSVLKQFNWSEYKKTVNIKWE